MKELGLKWKNMTEQEKFPYNDAYEKSKE